MVNIENIIKDVIEDNTMRLQTPTGKSNTEYYQTKIDVCNQILEKVRREDAQSEQSNCPPDIEKQRELLLDFMTYVSPEAFAKHSKAELADNYLRDQQSSNTPIVSTRFSIRKIILSDFALFAIIDNEQNKVVCHLVYDNGEQYCDEMANKMLAGLNGG